MTLDWSLLHNFTNCAHFTFPIEVVLKLLEQLHYLNLL
jgi:hypothetical protein